MHYIFLKKKTKKEKLAKKFGAVKPRKEAPKILNVLLFLIIISVMIFLLVGGLYDVFNRPPMIISRGESFSFFIPSMGSQTISESIFTAMLTIIGVGGLIIAYKSVKSGRTSRLVSIALIGSMIMLIIGVLGLQLLFAVKVG